MKRLNLALSIFGLFAMSGLAQVAHANPFTNGGFELGAVDPSPSFITLSSGSTDITGWTVLPVNVDYIGGYWTAGEGTRSVDLNGLNIGGLSQTFDTVNGQTYNVRFLLSGNPDNGPTTKTLDVFTNGASHSFSFDANGHSRVNMGWTPESFIFVATGASTTIEFMSTTNISSSTINGGCPCYGPALDGVSVTAVPEPETYAMLLAGLGLMGFIARRRLRIDAA